MSQKHTYLRSLQLQPRKMAKKQRGKERKGKGKKYYRYDLDCAKRINVSGGLSKYGEKERNKKRKTIALELLRRIKRFNRNCASLKILPK